jgi:hypothetical protein
MTWNGKLKRVDLGTGGWVLETDDGQRVTLFGDIPAALENRNVEVQGREMPGGVSFLMTGDKMIQVSRISQA